MNNRLRDAPHIFCRKLVLLTFLTTFNLFAPLACQQPQKSNEKPNADKLNWKNCELDAPGDPYPKWADCLFLDVPKRYDLAKNQKAEKIQADSQNQATNKNSTSLRLRIARLKATGKKPKADPIYFLAGGPGQAASEAYWAQAAAFSRLRKQRDIYLVDQRGTGASQVLKCPQVNASDDENGGRGSNSELGLSSSADAAQKLKELEDCLKTMHPDPLVLTTEQSAEDIEQVRKKLGVEKLNLYGISYGTRLAQEYMLRYPEHVRSAVLDGVLPRDTTLGPQIARDAQRAMKMTLQRCADDKACHKRFANLPKKLSDLQERFQQREQKFRVADPHSGRKKDISLKAEDLAALLRMLNYASETSALLPLIIDEAASGSDAERLAKLTLLVDGSIGKSINQIMHLSVLCAEDYPFWKPADFATASIRHDSLFLPLQQNLQKEMHTGCALWPQAHLDKGIKQALHSDIPTLLLSGEVDPVTPPEQAEHLRQTLSHSLHIVAQEQGHGVAQRGCIPRLIKKFFDTAQTEKIDASCLNKMRAPPFFVSPSGPEP